MPSFGVEFVSTDVELNLSRIGLDHLQCGNRRIQSPLLSKNDQKNYKRSGGKKSTLGGKKYFFPPDVDFFPPDPKITTLILRPVRR